MEQKLECCRPTLCQGSNVVRDYEGDFLPSGQSRQVYDTIGYKTGIDQFAVPVREFAQIQRVSTAKAPPWEVLYGLRVVSGMQDETDTGPNVRVPRMR